MKTEQIGDCAMALNFLARLFIEMPEMEFIDRIRENDVFGKWPLVPLDTDTADALRFLEDETDSHGAAAHAALLTEYTTLFIGPGNPIPLWESVWTTKDKLLFDGPMFDVRKAYAQYGLASPNPEHEPDDHIGLEISFLGGVMGCVAAAIDDGDMKMADEHVTMAGEFLHAHLSRWAVRFFETVGSHEKASFYKAVSIVGADALAQAARILRPDRN